MEKSGTKSQANRRISAPSPTISKPDDIDPSEKFAQAMNSTVDHFAQIQGKHLTRWAIFFELKTAHEELDAANDCIKAAVGVLDYVSSLDGIPEADRVSAAVSSGIGYALSVATGRIDIQLNRLMKIRQEENG